MAPRRKDTSVLEPGEEEGGGVSPSIQPDCKYELNGYWDDDFTNVLDHLSPEADGIYNFSKRKSVIVPPNSHSISKPHTADPLASPFPIGMSQTINMEPHSNLLIRVGSAPPMQSPKQNRTSRGANAD